MTRAIRTHATTLLLAVAPMLAIACVVIPEEKRSSVVIPEEKRSSEVDAGTGSGSGAGSGGDAGADAGGVKDSTLLTISAVNATGITANNATITWTTDKTSTSQVEYGTTAAYGSSTTLSSALVTSHAMSLSGLTAGKAYHFRVHSTDAAGNAALSSDYTLTTLTTAAPPTGPAYYVATTGNDANPGTETQPFRTIQKAADVVNPGDTVIVKDGTYVSTYVPGWDTIVHVTRGGTAGKYITFKSENPLGAKLSGQSNAVERGWVLEASYIRIEGFEIYGVHHSGLATWGASHVQIVGNNFHDIGRFCSNANAGFVGIFAANSADYTIEDNAFHDSGRFDSSEEGCALLTYQQQDHGIYMATMDTVTIKNNVFYNLFRGYSIQLYNMNSQVSSTNVKIVNNTMSGTATTASGHIMLGAPGVTNATIENNISYQPHTGYMIVYYLPALSNVVVRNNITYQGVISKSSPPAGITFSGNLDNTDPHLVSPSTHDFHLQAGSPAIDTGVSTAPPVTTDFDGIARPQGAAIDIGAFEFTH